MRDVSALEIPCSLFCGSKRCCAPPSVIRTNGKGSGFALHFGHSRHPKKQSLPLLPSDPDGVRPFSSSGSRHFNTFHQRLLSLSCLVGEFNPAIADCRLQATADRPSSTAGRNIPNRLRPRKPDRMETGFPTGLFFSHLNAHQTA